MFSPWQMESYGPMGPMLPVRPTRRPVTMMIIPMGHPGLMMTAAGAFPVPESISPKEFPPAVRESIARLFEGPPKPAVSRAVMNQTQRSMIAPDLPCKADV